MEKTGKVGNGKSKKNRTFIIILIAVIALVAASFFFIGTISPHQESFTITKSFTQDNFTLTVISVHPSIDIHDCRIIVKKANGTTALNTLLENITNIWMNGVKFNDKDSDGNISVSDYFQLDRGEGCFGEGTQFLLTTPDMKGQYAAVVI